MKKYFICEKMILYDIEKKVTCRIYVINKNLGGS